MGCVRATRTARRIANPYDIVLCASLLVIKHHLGDNVRLSSDGRRNEPAWRKGVALHDYIFKDRDGETLAGEIEVR